MWGSDPWTVYRADLNSQIEISCKWSWMAFITRCSHSPIHALIHTPTAVITMQGDSQLVAGVGCLAQGHLETPLVAGYQTGYQPTRASFRYV